MADVSDVLIQILPLINNLTPVVIAAIQQLLAEHPGATIEEICDAAEVKFDEVILKALAELKKEKA